MMRAHAGKIRGDIQSYEAHVLAYKEELQNAEYYRFSTGPRRAKELLDSANHMHQQQKNICEKMRHIANVFECVRDMEGPIATIAAVGELLKDFRVLWDANQKVANAIEEVKSRTWGALDPEELEDSAKNLVTSVRRLPKSIKGTDAFEGLDSLVKDFIITCPIIVSLRSPAMRERHWRELMEVVKKQFPLPSENPNTPLRQLMEMELHVHAAGVEEIAEKATKEAKHEDTLRSLEATWSAVNFSMSFYKDSDVPLLKLDDDVVEQLESDQMAVQSIVGSRYPYFRKDAMEWQKSLGAVSDVTQLLAELQRTWSYLEPLFIASEEVKRELPDDAKKFEEVDAEVRSILQKAWKVRNVKEVCQQSGLLDKVQQLERKQDECKKSLSEFLDSKRRQFPRFFFMSEADLLDLLSNSSQPSRVLQQVTRISTK
jgi:dynein heavy chain